jgi:hypothetical protein
MTCLVTVLSALLVLSYGPIAFAGELHCEQYDDCRVELDDDAAAEARHRCQTGSRDDMLACRDDVAAGYRERNKDRCASLLAACGRTSVNVQVEQQRKRVRDR